MERLQAMLARQPHRAWPGAGRRQCADVSRAGRTGIGARFAVGMLALTAMLSVILGTTGVAGAEPDRVLATVNGVPLRESDAYAAIESMPLEDQINMRSQMDLVVQSLVNEEILFQYVLQADGEAERELRRQLKALAVEQLIQRYVKSRLEVTDEEIREYYRENRDELRGWHVRVRQIVLPDRSDCEAMLARIDSEETFARLAEAHSIHEASAKKGGDLGNLMYAPDGPEGLGFEMEFFEMDLHEMRIFESQYGCHLVRVVNIDDPPDPPFERIREFLTPKLQAAKERSLLQALLERASSGVEIALTPRDSSQ